MEKLKSNIRLPVFIILVLLQYTAFSQSFIKAEAGVRIVSQPGNYLVVDNGPFALTSPGIAYPTTIDNLKIEADASLTIKSSSYLTVKSILSILNIPPCTTCLVIESGGSLIESSGALATVNCSITPASKHMISAPVSNAVSGMFITGNTLQEYTEPAGHYDDILTPAEPLTPVKGFELTGGSLLTATFAGPLNTGVQSYLSTYTFGAGNGWNLVGNPYPSSIDWNASSGWTKTNVNASIYIRNNSGWAVWDGTWGANGGTQYIAPEQGFFITASANGTLGMNNDVRVHNNTTFFKNSDAGEYTMVRLEVSGNGYADEAIVWFLSSATPEFDGAYDAYKLYGDVAVAAQIYTLGSIPLAINALPETNTVPLGIHAGANGNYTIAATGIRNLSLLNLEDTKTGIFTNLLTDVYTFNLVPGENELRFLLHFGPTAVKEKATPTDNIYSYKQTVYVDMKEQLKGEIFIYAVSGQLVATETAKLGLNKITLANGGIYVVRLVTDHAIVVRKVSIR